MNRRGLLKGLFSSLILAPTGLAFSENVEKSIVPNEIVEQIPNEIIEEYLIDIESSWASQFLMVDEIGCSLPRYEPDMFSFNKNKEIVLMEECSILECHEFSCSGPDVNKCILDIKSQVDKMFSKLFFHCFAKTKNKVVGSITGKNLDKCFGFLENEGFTVTKFVIHPNQREKFESIYMDGCKDYDRLWTADVIFSNNVPENLIVCSADKEYCGVLFVRENCRINHDLSMLKGGMGLVEKAFSFLEITN